MNVNPQLLEAIANCLWVKNRYGKSTICTLSNTGATAISYRNCINIEPENGMSSFVLNKKLRNKCCGVFLGFKKISKPVSCEFIISKDQ